MHGLTPGQIVESFAERGKTAYFQIPITSEDEKTCTITVTPLGEGDPDLYASVVDALPNARSEFSARGYGTDSLSIHYNQYKDHNSINVAVYGWRNVNFTIVASFESSKHISSRIMTLCVGGSTEH